jgi:hypothetical protein
MNGPDPATLDVPMVNTPPPLSNEIAELRAQFTWLTARYEEVVGINNGLNDRIDEIVGINNGLNEKINHLTEQVGLLNETRLPHKKEMKSADPPVFGGNPKEVEAFLLACRLRFSTQRSRFDMESDKVLHAISFLTGPPKSWIQPAANRFLMGDTTVPEFTSFEVFAASLKMLYGDPNLRRTAIAALKTIKQTSSVAEYISRFISHSQHTDLNDPALREYFYDGLKEAIKDELATRQCSTLQELQETATRLDARLQERRMERNRMMHRSQDPIVASTPMTTNTRLTIKRSPWASSPAPPAFAAPAARPFQAAIPASTDGSTPMELDSQRKLPAEEHERCLKSGLCFNCKGQGHMSRDCPRKKVRIAGVEMELEMGAQQPENDEAQE